MQQCVNHLCAILSRRLPGAKGSDSVQELKEAILLATIGYEKAELGDFIATLRVSEIDILIDVRDRAQSRRAGFSKSALSDALSEAGIGYLHLKELGDPKEGREAARRGDFAQFRRIFSSVLKTEEAKEALRAVENLALSHSICLMCFERDQRTCHRKLLADRLEIALERKANHLGVKHGIQYQKAAA